MGKLQMKQLADMVGVSTSTISRAFRSPHLVHPKTRARILQVAREANYIYNAAAGDLSSKKSTVIGVLVPTTKCKLFSDSFLAIQDKAQEKQFSIIIGNTKYVNEIEKELLLQFQGRRVAGIILTGFGFGHEKIVEDLIKNGIPCVVIWETFDSDTISYVGFDNFKAAYTVIDYLVRLRHRRIGLIIGPYSKIRRNKKRFEGYRAALEDHGIPFEMSLVIERDIDFFEGKQGMIKLLSLPEPPLK
jgi:DNA-binding LacI/PurR family transcriptional regulator